MIQQTASLEIPMQGTVTYYRPDVDSGKIAAGDGSFYSFRKSDWSSGLEPAYGMTVIFETRQQPSVFKRALKISPAVAA
jgi:hypothetical protein